MQRLPEPELMIDAAQCQVYASADFAASNQMFVETVGKLISAGAVTVLDVGCGPGDVMIRLAGQHPSLKITAVDGSPAMIRLATKAVENRGLSNTIKTLQGCVPGLALPAGHFDAVLSKDFLHHLPEPSVFWHEVRRLVKPGGLICVVDLRRPESAQAAQAIVDAVAGREAEILRVDFFNSLLAAFTPAEIHEQLKSAELDLEVTILSDRHMLIQGYAP